MKIKRITAFLLCAAMIFCVCTAFADEAAENEEITENETVSQTAEPKDYNDIASFLNLFRYKIMQGDETGNLNFQEPVTRAEMAQIILNAKNIMAAEANADSDDMFTDVGKDHWAYNTVYTARDLGIINGNGDGTFSPDDNVTYEQAVKMITATLGYEPLAEAKGGYPEGYMAAAEQIGLTKSISFNPTDNALRKDIAILIDTALDIPLMVQTSSGSDEEYTIMDGKDGKELVTLKNGFED